MSIEIGRDELLTLSQAARLFPQNHTGKPISPGAVWRWAQPGHVPLLETIRVKRTYYTTRQALQAFAEACTVATGGSPPPRSAGERSRSVSAAEALLDALGVK
jgi:hypothetical protein